MRSFGFKRYLAILLFITIAFFGISLSRFTTSTATDDSARVAKFDVSVTHTAWSGDEHNDVFVADAVGGSTEYIFTVTNNSEVVIRAQLIVVDANQSVALNPSGWFEIPMKESRDVTATVVGVFEGNNVQMYIEYEQID